MYSGIVVVVVGTGIGVIKTGMVMWSCSMRSVIKKKRHTHLRIRMINRSSLTSPMYCACAQWGVDRGGVARLGSDLSGWHTIALPVTAVRPRGHHCQGDAFPRLRCLSALHSAKGFLCRAVDRCADGDTSDRRLHQNSLSRASAEDITLAKAPR
jgi:hypothetical protein